MKINIAIWDRVLRFLLGVFFMTWLFLGGAWWGVIGLYLLITAGWGWSLEYSILKISTARIPRSDLDNKVEIES